MALTRTPPRIAFIRCRYEPLRPSLKGRVVLARAFHRKYREGGERDDHDARHPHAQISAGHAHYDARRNGADRLS